MLNWRPGMNAGINNTHMYYLCQHSLSVLGQCLAQNCDTFKLHRFPACIKQIILHIAGSLGFMKSSFLHGSLHAVGTGIIYAEKS